MKSRNDVNPTSFLARVVPLYVAVFLLFGPYIAGFFESLNRRLYLWERLDAVWLAGTTVAVTALLAIGGGVARRLFGSRVQRLCDHGFLILLGAGLFASVAFHFEIDKFAAPMQTAWLALFALVGWSFARPESRVVERLRTLCFVLSPGAGIVLSQLMMQAPYPCPLDTWESRAKSARTVSNTEDATPVYLFIFDEWSAARSFENGRLRAIFGRLNEFADRATLYTDARSPATCTIETMPRLLFQVDRSLSMGGGRIGFESIGGSDPTRGMDFIPARDCESLFSVAKNGGYETAIISFMLPYKMWFGSQLDFCRSYSRYQYPYPAPEKMVLHAFNAVQHWTDPWTPAIRLRLQDWEEAVRVSRLRHDAIQDTIRVIEERPLKTFALFHHLLPHAPFLSDDTPGNQSIVDAQIKDRLAGYEKNLATLDDAVRRFIDAMRRAGRYDDALIILTSDHGWREDPNPAFRSQGALTHVPLIVKFPRQQIGEIVPDRFDIVDVGQWIRAAVAGEWKPNGSMPELAASK